MLTKENLDILKDVNPYFRRVVRRLTGFVVAGILSGFLLFLQETLLPDLQEWLGYEFYSVLYTGVFSGFIASIDVLAKRLREDGIYLPI